MGKRRIRRNGGWRRRKGRVIRRNGEEEQKEMGRGRSEGIGGSKNGEEK